MLSVHRIKKDFFVHCSVLFMSICVNGVTDLASSRCCGYGFFSHFSIEKIPRGFNSRAEFGRIAHSIDSELYCNISFISDYISHRCSDFNLALSSSNEGGMRKMYLCMFSLVCGQNTMNFNRKNKHKNIHCFIILSLSLSSKYIPNMS